MLLIDCFNDHIRLVRICYLKIVSRISINDFILSLVSISKGYCRLNSIVADVARIAVASSVVAVHPEVSVIRTAVLGCRQ